MSSVIYIAPANRHKKCYLMCGRIISSVAKILFDSDYSSECHNVPPFKKYEPINDSSELLIVSIPLLYPAVNLSAANKQSINLQSFTSSFKSVLRI